MPSRDLGCCSSCGRERPWDELELHDCDDPDECWVCVCPGACESDDGNGTCSGCELHEGDDGLGVAGAATGTSPQ